MKNKTLLLQLQNAVKEVRKKAHESEEQEKVQEEKENREKARKLAESNLKKLDKDMLIAANRGETNYIVDCLFANKLLSGDGSNIDHWAIPYQELFKLLDERGYEPELRKRKNGDKPYAYTATHVPYNIVVSWEEEAK